METEAFYKRELPCILKLLDKLEQPPSCIVVDGYVFLDGKKKASDALEEAQENDSNIRYLHIETPIVKTDAGSTVSEVKISEFDI